MQRMELQPVLRPESRPAPRPAAQPVHVNPLDGSEPRPVTFVGQRVVAELENSGRVSTLTLASFGRQADDLPRSDVEAVIAAFAWAYPHHPRIRLQPEVA